MISYGKIAADATSVSYGVSYTTKNVSTVICIYGDAKNSNANNWLQVSTQSKTGFTIYDNGTHSLARIYISVGY